MCPAAGCLIRMSLTPMYSTAASNSSSWSEASRSGSGFRHRLSRAKFPRIARRVRPHSSAHHNRSRGRSRGRNPSPNPSPRPSRLSSTRSHVFDRPYSKLLQAAALRATGSARASMPPAGMEMGVGGHVGYTGKPGERVIARGGSTKPDELEEMLMALVLMDEL
jgi:hypothetical protein